MENEYTVVKIEGEYATLRAKDGEELFIALFLLPGGTDVGSCLLYKDFEFSLV